MEPSTPSRQRVFRFLFLWATIRVNGFNPVIWRPQPKRRNVCFGTILDKIIAILLEIRMPVNHF